MLLALTFLACDGGAVGGGPPQITILEPTDGDVVCGTPLHVETEVSGIELVDPYDPPDPPRPGTGHLDLMLNGQDALMSDQEIVDFVVARYGEFVLLKPRFSAHTWVLWLATPIILLMALAAIIFAYRRRESAAAGPKPLTAGEKRRLKRLVNQG